MNLEKLKQLTIVAGVYNGWQQRTSLYVGKAKKS